MKNNFSVTLKNLFFPPKCISCGERLSPLPSDAAYSGGQICFCRSCFAKWQAERAALCPTCKRPATDCICVPEGLKGYKYPIPAVCFYNADGRSATNKLIFGLKRIRQKDLFDYAAGELCLPLGRLLGRLEIDPEDCIFTWLPRKKESVSRYGFDQGELLASAVASLFGSEAIPLFKRIGGREQKRLDSAARRENAQHAIWLLHSLEKAISENRSPLQGKYIILLDDMVTSGATTARGLSLLQDAGAAGLLIACFARG